MGDYNDPFMRSQNAAVQGRTKTQTRANVLQLKLIGQSHPTGLTTNLLKLFEPRPPLEFKSPPEKRKCPSYTGMAQFVTKFAEPGDPNYAPPVQKGETPAQRKARIHKLRLEKGAEKAAEELKKYDPGNDPNISGDPYKTLFVSKLSYETSESKLKREFESYGPIKRDAVSQKPRGYAFIEYMHTRDMKAAYKQADGRKIDGRRVLVDVERGRTVPNWRPRRLGGGLGTSRVGGEDASQRQPGREQVQAGGPSRSEEPRAKEERHDSVPRDREKSRERGRERDKEREKSRERSHDKPRDRDHRDDRHHRDRDRDKERDRDRGRDRGHDRDRARDRHDRDKDRDRERDRRPRDRDRDRGRDYEMDDRDKDYGRSHDRESEYDRVDSKHDRDRRDRGYDQPEADDDREYGQIAPDHEDGQYDHYEHHRERGRYDDPSHADRYDHYPDESHRYDQMEEDNYPYDRAASRDRDRS